MGFLFSLIRDFEIICPEKRQRHRPYQTAIIIKKIHSSFRFRE